jgi:alkylation response protein AidB-like acyl-CoA dehydrogenase
MDYLTQERRLLQESARDFAMEVVLPIANKLDPERGEIPAGIRNKLAELGYFGIMIPEEYGASVLAHSNAVSLPRYVRLCHRRRRYPDVSRYR